jgi:hypothetical protein
MAKDKISQYSTTNALNTDIGGIDIDENCLPSNLNDAIREVMVQLREFQDGSSADPLTITGDFEASGAVDFTSTGAVKLPVGTDAQRPTPAAGMFRFNDDNNEFEGYDGTAWGSIGGGAEISDDTTTATELYPVFVDATTGAADNVYVSDGKLGFTPSTGELAASQLVASNGIVVNSATVTANYTIPTGFNASSAGPIEVASGVTVTVSAGSVWVVL